MKFKSVLFKGKNIGIWKSHINKLDEQNRTHIRFITNIRFIIANVC